MAGPLSYYSICSPYALTFALTLAKYYRFIIFTWPVFRPLEGHYLLQ